MKRFNVSFSLNFLPGMDILWNLNELNFTYFIFSAELTLKKVLVVEFTRTPKFTGPSSVIIIS